MVGICLLVLFVIPLMYRVVKHSLQSIFKKHKRLPEESDLVSISTDSEKQKRPIDFTDPTDSDGYFAWHFVEPSNPQTKKFSSIFFRNVLLTRNRSKLFRFSLTYPGRELSKTCAALARQIWLRKIFWTGSWTRVIRRTLIVVVFKMGKFDSESLHNLVNSRSSSWL